jgi:hypothetical protein
MREALLTAMFFVWMLALAALMATARLFHGYIGVLWRNYRVEIGLYLLGLYCCLALALYLVFRKYRSLRITGGKLSRVEKELREDGWIEN